MAVPRSEITDKVPSPQAFRPHPPHTPLPDTYAPESRSWNKSSWSGPAHDCCEVRLDRTPSIGFRDSHHPDTVVLEFTRNEWLAFLQSHRSGQRATGMRSQSSLRNSSMVTT
ncbi:DUF397 domain-containing protein [Nocardiopsis alkaliphila]|uniref:DUF397 domain-containing protein n=1 Tax=Nocardiopsis alkaliphila TaxID=225762 RepID=UPI000A074315